MKKYLRNLFSFISRNKYLYRFASRIVFDHRGENNCDIATNGEMAALRKYLRAGSIVFDVGANIGEWTQTVLRLYPDATVHCFEPCQDTFLTLKTNNFPGSVILNNFGLGSKKETKDLYISDHDSTINSVYLRKDLSEKNDYKKEKISLDSLDDYCAAAGLDKIDFLKIDVEGNEFEVLLGAKRMLAENKIRMIQLEYGGTYIEARRFLKDIFDYFNAANKFNYVFYKIMPDRVSPLDYHEDLDNFQYCNYLIVNNTISI